MVALDSDAVVGFLDRSDGLHQAADATIRELAVEHRLAVSVITYAEVLTGVRLGHHSEEKVAGFFREAVSEIFPVKIEVADRASALRARNRSLRMPDALIVATADLEPGVNLLLTGDQGILKVKGLDCDIRLLATSPQ